MWQLPNQGHRCGAAPAPGPSAEGPIKKIQFPRLHPAWPRAPYPGAACSLDGVSFQSEGDAAGTEGLARQHPPPSQFPRTRCLDLQEDADTGRRQGSLPCPKVPTHS